MTAMNNIGVIESQSSIPRKENGMRLKLACSDQKRSKVRERPPLLDVVAEKILTELPNACLIHIIKTELLKNICVCFNRTNIYEECLFFEKKEVLGARQEYYAASHKKTNSCTMFD